jgi:hypothetical protein
MVISEAHVIKSLGNKSNLITTVGWISWVATQVFVLLVAHVSLSYARVEVIWATSDEGIVQDPKM